LSEGNENYNPSLSLPYSYNRTRGYNNLVIKKKKTIAPITYGNNNYLL